MTRPPHTVTLRPYAAGDLELLRGLLGDAEAMRYLGGAESEPALRERHARYLASDSATEGLFVVVADATDVGWVGFWEGEWEGESQFEAGWHVLPTWQGRGIAARAVALLLARARSCGAHRFVDAFPSVDHVASNAVCRGAGFSAMGEVQVEYPKGRLMRATWWRHDLAAPVAAVGDMDGAEDPQR